MPEDRNLYSELHNVARGDRHSCRRKRCAQTQMGPAEQSASTQLRRNSTSQWYDCRIDARVAAKLRGQSK